MLSLFILLSYAVEVEVEMILIGVSYAVERIERIHMGITSTIRNRNSLYESPVHDVTVRRHGTARHVPAF
jgi:hypothetical protein